MGDNELSAPAGPTNPDRTSADWTRLGWLWVIASVLVVGLILFRDFVFGGAILLYKDIGADSLNYDYPTFVHFSRYLRTEGFPSWSFYIGMGHDLFPFIGLLLFEPVCWLARELIAPALVYQHLLKVVIAGLLFFAFLRRRNADLLPALLGCVLLGFSGYMCMGACWSMLAEEVIGFAALLLAIEIFLTSGRWIFLPLGVALIGLISAFHLYLAAILLLFYVPGRLLADESAPVRNVVAKCLVAAAVAVLGLGLGAVVIYPNLQSMLASPRGTGPTSFFSSLIHSPVFGLATSQHYVAAVYRMFSTDMLGGADKYHGWANYLEAPIPYCGLISLLLLPQAFLRTSGRQKLVYGLFLGALVFVTVFPWFRHLFWGFQGDYYRTLSLFSAFGLITLGMLALSRYLAGAFNVWLFGGTALLAVVVLYLPWPDLQKRIDTSLRLQAVVLICAYTGLLTLGHILKRPRLFAIITTLVLVSELTLFDTVTVSSRRATVRKNDLTQPIGYNDDTVDALNDIRATDNSPFYRLTKQRLSSMASYGGLNDAMVFGYYGTSSYQSFNNINYIRFLMAVESMPPDSEQKTRWATGLLWNPVLSLFAGEKYVLTDDLPPYETAAQYELIKHYEPDSLFRNNAFLPLGLSFDRFITEEAFAQIPANEKPAILLEAAVLSPEVAAKNGLRSANVSELQQEAAHVPLPAVLERLRGTGLRLTTFHQARFEGKVSVREKSVLVVQTPFDRGWSALQDGKPAPVFQADEGLLGIAIVPGEHDLKISYRNPFMGTGGWISLGSALVLAVAMWRWPRLTPGA